jgi:1-acyl-sn-glycerol-3-phosphate acyltransferase
MRVLRAGFRIVRIAVSTAVLYFVYRLGRLIVRKDRAWRHRMVRAWARALCNAFGVRVCVEGTPPTGGFLMVSNHISYIDVLVIAQYADVAFIAKSEVRQWPVLGHLAAATGTIFIDRSSRRDAVRVGAIVEEAVRGGLGVLLFPEGTSGDGRDVLPFKAALLDGAARTALPVHHAALRYEQDEVAWVGEVPFGKHAGALLQVPRIDAVLMFGGSVVASDRKELADRLRDAIRSRVVPEA